MLGTEKLRAAEKAAKEARRRLWKDWQSSAPQITGREKEFSGTVVEVINGDALLIKLANGQVKKIFLSSIRPPRENGRYVESMLWNALRKPYLLISILKIANEKCYKIFVDSNVTVLH